MILIKNSITKTATQEDSATVSKPFSKNASSSATISPATADHTLPVDEKTAGNVIAAKTAYGM